MPWIQAGEEWFLLSKSPVRIRVYAYEGYDQDWYSDANFGTEKLLSRKYVGSDPETAKQRSLELVREKLISAYNQLEEEA
jgi:hypothetical protein